MAGAPPEWEEPYTSLKLLPFPGGGDHMVTYADLFQFGIFIVALISLVIQIKNKK